MSAPKSLVWVCVIWDSKMMLRTHLALALIIILLFLPHITSNKMLFIVVTLVSTVLPDIDSGFSTVGKFKGLRPLQFLTKHRGVIHSLSFCILISVLLSLAAPLIAFSFFLGYAVHLFADSFTIEGITPFWPYSRISNWRLRTGGRIESTLFLVFVIIDLILFFLIVQQIV